MMVPEDVERSDTVDEALLYLAYSMFSLLHSLAENGQLYVLKAEELVDWLEVTKYQLERGRLPTEFREVPLRVMEAFSISRPREPNTQVIQAD